MMPSLPTRVAVAALAGTLGLGALSASSESSVSEFLRLAREGDVPAIEPRRVTASTFHPDIGELMNYAAANAKRLDWAQALGSSPRVVILGETHPDESNKRAMSEQLDRFRTAGVTHLALEMFGDDLQPQLNLFAEGTQDSALVRRILARTWGWRPEVYTMLVDSARREPRVGVAAVDVPHEERETAIRRMCPQGSPANCSQKARVSEIYLAWRDDRIAFNVDQLLKRSGVGRVVLLVGALHSDPAALPARLKALGHESRVVVFIHTKDPHPNEITDRFRTGMVAARARRNELRGVPVFLPTPRAATGYDGFISLKDGLP
ncbi:MAG: ChaN family lipoprotein [Elusimicrobia bacterium]|nr:ChaN family lipoprotein [Elusimicrobiota bacterium]